MAEAPSNRDEAVGCARSSMAMFFWVALGLVVFMGIGVLTTLQDHQWNQRTWVRREARLHTLSCSLPWASENSTDCYVDFEAIKAQKGRGRGKLPYAEYTLTYSYTNGQQTYQRKVFLYSPSFYRWNSTDLVETLRSVTNGPTHHLNVPFALMVDARDPEKSTIELRRDMSPFQTYWQLFCGSLLVSVVLFGLLRLMKITVFGKSFRPS